MASLLHPAAARPPRSPVVQRDEAPHYPFPGPTYNDAEGEVNKPCFDVDQQSVIDAGASNANGAQAELS